jgi:glutathione S-transferase
LLTAALTRGIEKGRSNMPHYSALVTLLAIALYFYTGLLVARARQKFGVKAPAIAGNADFERAFRVQQNTLEWMPIFLPLLWLFALYVNDLGAALLGLVWIAGRVLYIRGYSAAAEQRHNGFSVQAFACGVLLIGSLAGIVWRIAGGW